VDRSPTVGSIWTWPAGWGTAELKLTETFQIISGILMVNGKDLPLQNGKLAGNPIRFSAGGEGYEG